jgi:hypothetical protein
MGGSIPEVPNRPVYDEVALMLEAAGLGSLIGWYESKLIEGASPAEIALLLQEQPAFKNRFKAIAARKEMGLPALSPSEVLRYEQEARGLLRASGLPEGFYDHFDDFADFLIADVSIPELAERVQQGYDRVREAAQEVKDAFYDFFGVSGPDALAAFFLDPERAVPLLKTFVGAAGVGGAAKMFGFNMDRGRAERLARASMDETKTRAAFSALVEDRALFSESFHGENTDLRMEFEGLDAAAGISEQALRMIEERRQLRLSRLGGRGGGAALGRAGFGFGTSGQ